MQLAPCAPPAPVFAGAQSAMFTVVLRKPFFTPEGKYLDTWPGFLQPCKIYVDHEDVMYVAELGDRVSIIDLEGNVLGRWGDERTHEPGKFWGPHGLWVDSQGSIYVGEVLQGARLQKFARRR